MTLDSALYILAEVHTRDDDVTGFVVEVGSSWHHSRVPQSEYLEAWRVVREHVHMQVEPLKSEPIAAATREKRDGLAIDSDGAERRDGDISVWRP